MVPRIIMMLGMVSAATATSRPGAYGVFFSRFLPRKKMAVNNKDPKMSRMLELPNATAEGIIMRPSPDASFLVFMRMTVPIITTAVMMTARRRSSVPSQVKMAKGRRETV